jgi:hypothetical protein
MKGRETLSRSRNDLSTSGNNGALNLSFSASTELWNVNRNLKVFGFEISFDFSYLLFFDHAWSKLHV